MSEDAEHINNMINITIRLCLIVSMAGVVKGKAETIRKQFYRLMNSLSWLTPIGWIMDWKTCSEIMKRLQELAEEFAKESDGKQLFYLTTIMMNCKELERLLQYSREPENPQVAMRLRKVLELLQQLYTELAI